MYTDICRVMIDMLPELPDQPTFSQLLGKMGNDAGHKRLFDRCVKYKHGEDDLVGTWYCKIADLVVEMDFDVILIECPLQITITNSESKQVLMSQTGAGWNDRPTSIGLTRHLMPKKSSSRSHHP